MSISEFRLPSGLALGALVGRIDGRLVGATAGIGLLVFVALGVAPAWHALNVGTAHLAGDIRRSHARGFRVGSGLFVSQIAASVLLFIGCSLLTRSVLNVLHKDYGFAANRVLSLVLQPNLGQYAAAGEDLAGERGLDYDRLVGRLRSAPGVASVTGGNRSCRSRRFQRESPSPLGSRRWARSAGSQCSPVRGWAQGDFATTGMQLQAGRDIGELDVKNPGVTTCVVSEALARLLWRGNPAIGRSISLKLGGRLRNLQVIGQVRDAVRSGIRGDLQPALTYRPT